MKIKEASDNIQNALENRYDKSEAKAITRILMEDVFSYRGGIDRVLHSRELERFEDAKKRLLEGEPVQYVTGISYFYDVKLYVNKNVLIPRPETEELVYNVLSGQPPHGARVLDIGTGSACIPIVLKRKRPDLEIYAIDKSEEALSVAKNNAEKYEVNIKFRQMDFLSELAWENYGLFEIIVSNPPYISRTEQHLMSDSTLQYEPDLALYPESEDVLIFYRKIARFAKEHLVDGGLIFLECNEFNIKEVAAFYPHSEILVDMQGKERMLVARY